MYDIDAPGNGVIQVSRHQLFISYHRADAGIARQIRDALVERDMRTWMDIFDIPLGAYWPDAIDRGLEQSDIVVGVLSTSALASRNVKNEWDWAIENHRQLVLVRTELCVLPHRYVSINLIDAFSADLGSVVDQIANVTGLYGVRASSAFPKTQYARSGEVSIAYQIVGQGLRDVVMVPGFISHVEHYWRDPRAARFLDQIAGFCRLVLFDKRGTGLSDRTAEPPTPEERMDDIRAVMDGAGLNAAVILGMSEGAAIACLYAARYPERVSGLITFGGLATHCWKPDYTWAPTVEEWQRQIDKQAETIHQQWGTLEAAAGFLNVLAPSGKDDPELQRWVAQLHRDGASPGAAIALHRMNLHLDVRAVLPNISAPALVLHRSGDRMCSIQGGRYLAEHIPNATLTQLDGEDHLPWIGNGDSVVEAIRTFVIGMGGDRSRGGLVESGVVTILVMRSSPLPESETGSECLRGHMEQSIAMFHGRAFEAGDGSFVVTFEGPMAAIHCAAALLTDSEAEDLGVRIGIHTGETGVRDSSGRGMAYVVAEKLAEMASPGEVLVSPAVRDLVAGSGLEFVNRGTLCLDLLPEQWHAFAVVSYGTEATP